MVKRSRLAAPWLVGLFATTSAGAPAAIMDSTPAGLADIRQAVATALGKDVLIADDALTKSSFLTIDRHVTKTMEGRIGSGRILDPPETFQLVLESDQCVLVHDRSGKAYPLENARCRVPPNGDNSAPPSH